jgi:hypothetical protein
MIAKKSLAYALAFVLFSSAYVVAQQTTTTMLGTGTTTTLDPFLRKGTRELTLSGILDFEQRGNTALDLEGAYGFFLRDYLEVGGFAELAGNFDDVFRYGLGAFAEYHLPELSFLQAPRAMPYIGASVGLAFVDSDISEDNAALIFKPSFGVKWFIRDFFAIDTNLYFAMATDDIYLNDEDDLDAYDVGMQIGIRVYFN